MDPIREVLSAQGVAADPGRDGRRDRPAHHHRRRDGRGLVRATRPRARAVRLPQRARAGHGAGGAPGRDVGVPRTICTRGCVAAASNRPNALPTRQERRGRLARRSGHRGARDGPSCGSTTRPRLLSCPACLPLRRRSPNGALNPRPCGMSSRDIQGPVRGIEELAVGLHAPVRQRTPPQGQADVDLCHWLRLRSHFRWSD